MAQSRQGRAAARPYQDPLSPPHTFLRNEPKSFSPSFRCIDFRYRILCRLQRRLQMGSFWKTNPFGAGVIASLDVAEAENEPESGRFEGAIMETFGRMECAVGPRKVRGKSPAYNVKTRNHCGRNSLEVARDSVYVAHASSLSCSPNYFGPFMSQPRWRRERRE